MSRTRFMSSTVAAGPLSWYVTAALPEPVKTAHLLERDPADPRYARSACGRERARLWDRVELGVEDPELQLCAACASTHRPAPAPSCPARNRTRFPSSAPGRATARHRIN